MYWSRNDSVGCVLVLLVVIVLIGTLAAEAFFDLGWRWWLDNAYVFVAFAAGWALGFKVGRLD